MDFIQNIELALKSNLIFGIIFFFIVGSCIASFFNVVVLRTPKMMEAEDASQIKEWLLDKKLALPEGLETYEQDINLSFPSSHCYSCKTPLKWYHNIPVFSYLFLRGKCGFCGVHISLQYPILELLGGITLATTFFLTINHGLPLFLLASFFSMICLLLAATDLKTFFLPDGLNYALLWVGLIAATQHITLLNITLSQAIYGAVGGFSLLWVIRTAYSRLRGIEAMGAGDLKLLAALGVYIGFKGIFLTIFYACFVGLIAYVVFKLFQTILKIKKNEEESGHVPFGPSLIIGAIIYLFTGDAIIHLLANI